MNITERKITKSQLCYYCRMIHPIMGNGEPFDLSIENLLDGKGYNTGLGFHMLNLTILQYLQDNGGCPGCIALFKRATQ